MRYAGVGQNGGPAQAATETRFPVSAAPGVKEIPYDYVATFRLSGIAGRRAQDVINISTEGTFIAVAVGYSFIPAVVAAPAVTAGPPPTVNGSPIAGSPFASLAGLPVAAFNPPTGGGNSDAQLIARTILAQMVKVAGIDFKYSVVDSATGRELQNQAIHNIAGLGSADGDRPFRPFARPALFVPRSTIRIEVEEISEGSFYKDAQLFIVLHGYKRLGE